MAGSATGGALGILSKPIKIGSFKVPLGLLILVGAALLAIISLTQKKKSGESANALVGQYDAAFDDIQTTQKPVTGNVPSSNPTTPTNNIPTTPTALLPAPAPSTSFASTSQFIAQQFGVQIAAPVAGQAYPSYPPVSKMPSSPSPFTTPTGSDVLFKPVLGSGSYITMPSSQLPSNAVHVGYRNGVKIYSPPGAGVTPFPY